ncbi:MAG: hypothetical protein ACI30D_06955 [Muribaculaceae bacterium]
MKKVTVLALCALTLAAASCSKDKSESTEEEVAVVNYPSTADSLRVALANQDSLLMLMNDVSEGLMQIKQMENILDATTGMSAEAQDKRQQIRNDILAIQDRLKINRERLANLERKLAESNNHNKTLTASIETLKKQIADQEGTIETLRGELAAANIKIDRLNNSVDSLNTTVANVSEERSQAQARAEALNAELNTCYYVVGTGKELKSKNVIESGFLRKTKVLPGDQSTSNFIKGNKSTLTTIPLYSKKAKVMTNQPASSYQLVKDANGSYTLKITNPGAFWEKSNFLVIKID